MSFSKHPRTSPAWCADAEAEIERLRAELARILPRLLSELDAEIERLRARIVELEVALEDAIDTLEAMDLHDNPLYERLRRALEEKAQ